HCEWTQSVSIPEHDLAQFGHAASEGKEVTGERVGPPNPLDEHGKAFHSFAHSSHTRGKRPFGPRWQQHHEPAPSRRATMACTVRGSISLANRRRRPPTGSISMSGAACSSTSRPVLGAPLDSSPADGALAAPSESLTATERKTGS